jgi:hypothetical protein
VAWVPIADEGVDGPLAFDHGEILRAALDRIRGKAEYTSLPVHLLPEAFTLTELQHAYEAVIARPLEKSAFRTRVLAAGFLEPTGGSRGGSNRPAALYRLRRGRDVIYFPRTFEPRRGAGRAAGT